MTVVLQDRFLPQLKRPVLDILPLAFAVGMDVVTAYIFGLEVAPNFTNNPELRLDWLRMDLSSLSSGDMFWAQELPRVWALFGRNRGQRRIATVQLRDWCLQLCDQAESVVLSGRRGADSEHFPTVYHHLRSRGKLSRLEIASELLDHLKATSDVFAITLAKALPCVHQKWVAVDQYKSCESTLARQYREGSATVSTDIA
ncbi:hypothetical protein NX059_012114 [Plenodomus lindquistii]|nr:hypothetical protein NX059_012114 [Plenodomus lindquistii]